MTCTSEDFVRLYIRYQAEAMPHGVSIQALFSRTGVRDNLFNKWYKDTQHHIVSVEVDVTPSERKDAELENTDKTSHSMKIWSIYGWPMACTYGCTACPFRTAKDWSQIWRWYVERVRDEQVLLPEGLTRHALQIRSRRFYNLQSEAAGRWRIHNDIQGPTFLPAVPLRPAQLLASLKTHPAWLSVHESGTER